LEGGPEVGRSRKEALERLLEVVEMEIGRMMLNDDYHARKVAKDSNSSIGSSGVSRTDRG
jgi:hypothetical protein